MQDTSNVPLYDSIVNGCGHFTSLGGSRLHPKALEAMAGVSNKFIDLNSLLINAGERIKHLCNAPPGYSGHVTTGASAGLALAVAACLCRNDLKIAEHLPDTAKCGGRTKIIVDGGSDTRWYQSMMLTGCDLVEVGQKGTPMTEAELRGAIDESTAGIVCFADGAPGILPLDVVVRIARAKDVPLIVDAAARLPPLSNLHHFCDLGVDCCLFSGGKMISGPQSSGFMLGKETFIAAARVNACPNETAVGRPMKTCKESIVGLVAALEQFVADGRAYPGNVNRLSSHLASLLKASPLSDMYLSVAVESGASMGLTDVQPNAHDLVFIHLKNIEYSKRSANAGSSSSHREDVYGDGVNHGSPMTIDVRSPGTFLASRLAEAKPQRIAVNTTTTGLLVNPIVMTMEEVSYMAEHILVEVGRMVSGEADSNEHQLRAHAPSKL